MKHGLFFFLETTMRYHSEEPHFYFPLYGEAHICVLSDFFEVGRHIIPVKKA